MDKPILGVCGGMQIIGKLFGGKLKKKTEIGYYKENFNKNFFGLIGESEVYHLHNYYADFLKLKKEVSKNQYQSLPKILKWQKNIAYPYAHQLSQMMNY